MALTFPDWQPQAPLQLLQLDWLAAAGVEVACLRLDLIDPLVSGNKWFKLAPHLHEAQCAGLEGIISLGGAHSNHLHAVAAAGQRFGFATVGLLRGEPQLTPTVADLQAYGMHLHWLGYAGYRQRHASDFWDSWRQRYPTLYPVNEGGRALSGARGCQVLREMVERQLPALGWSGFEGWWLAAGTGTTLAGLVLAERGARTVHGAMAVPAAYGVPEQVSALLGSAGCADEGYRLLDAARGGFARADDALRNFIGQTEHACGLPLEAVYTGKALLALQEQVTAGLVPPDTRLVFVHTGGLQGRRASLDSDYTQV